MSSTVSTIELKTLPTKAVTDLKLEDRQHRLNRSGSIEKIKKFNSFICSQQYYILPAILNWLRSSQSGLETSTEKTIFFFRSLFFATFLSKFINLGYGANKKQWSSVIFLNNLNALIATLISNFYQKFTKCFESTFLLTTVVYLTCFIIVAQLLISIYLIYQALVPVGFFFLIGCMLTIKYLCYKTLFFDMSRGNTKLKYKRS